jgi:hypothetical protein
MFDATNHHGAKASTRGAALNALKDYVGENREALLNAAQVLGGKPGWRISQSVIDGIHGPKPPTRRTMRQLSRLLDLLKLENAYEHTLEAAQLALLDPADPYVEELCLLADELSILLGDYRAAADELSSDIGKRTAE